jgi:hypothetical protein
MSTADCKRWIELADQAGLGEHLSTKDRAWLSHHASVCNECGSEAALYTSLREALGRPEMLVVPAQTVAQPAPRRLRWTLSACLALAAGVAVALGTHAHLRTRDSGASARPVAPPAMTAHIRFASGQARVGAMPAQAGQEIPQGEHISTGDAGLVCIGLANSVDVCLGSGSAATLARTDATQIVYLDKGTVMARLAHQAADRKFLVRTGSAEVQAVGTLFSVRLADDGTTRVRLHEGRLAVRATTHVSTDLAAPVQATIAQDIRVAPITHETGAEDKPLTDLFEVAGAESGTTLTINSKPADADVLIDNVAIGRTPISMFLTTPAHLRLSLQGYEPISDWIEIGDKPRVDLAFTLTEVPTPSVATHRPPVRHADVSPGRLLAQAQSLRAQGHYDACARLYRRLWSQFPQSEEAKVSMISLGELELVHAKSPAAALAAFNAYLQLGGPLEREARFGKLRALRMLDRREEADVESARFLRDFPASIQATILRQERHGR